MRKYLAFAFFSAVLSACTPKPAVAPVEQVQQKMPTEIATETVKKKTNPAKDKTVLYQCKKGKTVRVTQTANNKKAKTLTVEFEQTSHKLSSSVPKSSKRKYSNIRWIWTDEFNGSSNLRDKNGKLLAENCVKK